MLNQNDNGGQLPTWGSDNTLEVGGVTLEVRQGATCAVEAYRTDEPGSGVVIWTGASETEAINRAEEFARENLL